ncbi:glycosyltransferase [Rossellomorea sp. DA94]|uniref:glycosyltransferase n=1 Tax=Rossellomorea sp. DA94 TaxID=3038653 RepID=UPI002449D38F|nr:glycosyltransferase [Rossellomorea sp. DA94]WGG48089.1 glycosyltransferase [Rossellomorea sp. DA94]
MESNEKLFQIKDKIEQMINEGYLNEAKELLNRIEKKVEIDSDILSMQGTLLILEGHYENARILLSEAIKKFPLNQDIMFNLAYVFEMENKSEEAYRIYRDLELIGTEDIQNDVSEAIDNLNVKRIEEPPAKKKLAFFVKKGMDSFLIRIIDELSENYIVKKIIINNLKDIEIGMKWCDICWFEWCDELIGYGSKLALANERQIICRVHSYEAFTNFPQSVNWENVNLTIFIAEHIREVFLENTDLDYSRTAIVPNEVDLGAYTFKERKPGYNIAFVGYINYKKGPMLLLHTFKSIWDTDKRYKLFIAGQYQDLRDKLYFDQMIVEMGMEDNVFFEGWQTDLDTWLEDKHYILCTSLLESQNVSVMQAMSKGIKPIIHNFVGAKNIYPSKFIWNTIDQAVSLTIDKEGYHSQNYREYIKLNYSLDSHITSIKKILSESY